MQNRYPIKTNFEDLDKIIGGLYPGELMIIGARPAIGKSSFLCTLIKQITLESCCKGLFFSLDLPTSVFLERLTSSISGISISRIRSTKRGDKNMPELTREESKIYKKVLAEVCDLPLIIDDSEYKKINDIYDSAREIFFREKGIDIIYIDVLGYITTDNVKVSIRDMIAEIVTKLKQLAMELKIPIVITCQVSRMTEPDPPGFLDLQYSSIIDIADVIILLDRKRLRSYFCQFQDVTLYVAKNNFGEIGEIKLQFSTETLNYELFPSSIKSSLIL